MIRKLSISVAAFATIAGICIGATGVADAAPFKDCTQAHNAGLCNIPKGDPNYWDGGDRDHDGIACEC
jgi:hypothetical protein